MKALYLLRPGLLQNVYGPAEQAMIRSMTDVIDPPLDTDTLPTHSQLLKEAEIIFSGWGTPKLDQAFLDAAPNLKLFLYGAGSIKGIVTDEFWERGITISSAWAANAVPVSEFTLAEIVLSLKRVWSHIYRTRAEKARPDWGHIP